MTVGENIKKTRIEKGLTQKRLGELCGISESNIRKYENNKQNPKYETVIKIAKALDSSPLKLYNGPDAQVEFDEMLKKSMLMKYDKMENELLETFWLLNKKGATIALERLKELTEIPRYVNDDEQSV